MLVTTSYEATENIKRQARRLADEAGAVWAERRYDSLRKLRERYGDGRILVVEKDGSLKYCEGGAAPLFFHPSTALLRVKKLLGGESDPLLEASGAQPGDAVLDCTAGLASDAIVFSFHVGPEGSVTAVESAEPLYRIVSRGLEAHDTGIAELNAAMRRIRLVRGEHKTVLRSMNDDSMDIVYFDPMFRSPLFESAAMQPLRPVANSQAVSQEAIREARRVARRSVVLKEQARSGEFARLGFAEVRRSYSKVAYGVIRL